MLKDLRVAVIQAKVPDNHIKGESQVLRFVGTAMFKPLDLIGLPEYCLSTVGEVKEGYKPLDFLSKVARDNKIYLFGANPVLKNNGKIYNTGFLFDREGKLISSYDKIVLTPHEEEAGLKKGNKLSVFDTEFGKAAIIICKDAFHRYASWFFEELRKKDVDIVLVPSSSIYVSERSINLWTDTLKSMSMLFNTYILAPGTTGRKPNGSEAFGHAMIICPKRVVLKEGSRENDEILYATLDSESVNWVKETVGKKWQPEKIPEFKVSGPSR